MASEILDLSDPGCLISSSFLSLGVTGSCVFYLSLVFLILFSPSLRYISERNIFNKTPFV